MAVPPRVLDWGLLMHVAIKVSVTLRSMSHVVECLSFAPTAMAQFPEKLLTIRTDIWISMTV